MREAVRRAGIDPAIVDECIMGNVIQAGNGQNPARQAALNGGLADHVAALTINKVCGSGLKAVMLAAQGIATGDIDIAVAGGMESMSNAPYLLPRVREGLRMGDGKARRLADQRRPVVLVRELPHGDFRRGGRREVPRSDATSRIATPPRATARRRTRRARAGSRTRSCRSASRSAKAIRSSIDTDEPIREDTTAEALAKLKPAFKKDGSVTAGNAPGVNDAAAAVVDHGGGEGRARSALTPMARIVGQATSGLPPKLVMMTPVEAVRKVAAKVGWNLNDVDLFEINEAFSVQAVAVMRELGIDPARVNVHGGAVALGHAIGASGARVLTTLLYAMKRRDAETRHRGALPRRRQRRGAGGRAELSTLVLLGDRPPLEHVRRPTRHSVESSTAPAELASNEQRCARPNSRTHAAVCPRSQLRASRARISAAARSRRSRVSFVVSATSSGSRPTTVASVARTAPHVPQLAFDARQSHLHVANLFLAPERPSDPLSDNLCRIARLSRKERGGLFILPVLPRRSRRSTARHREVELREPAVCGSAA